MSTQELLKEIEFLSLEEKTNIEKAIRELLLKEQVQLLTNGADALLNDYKADAELTAFTSLDFEHFYEAR